MNASEGLLSFFMTFLAAALAGATSIHAQETFALLAVILEEGLITREVGTNAKIQEGTLGHDDTFARRNGEPNEYNAIAKNFLQSHRLFGWKLTLHNHLWREAWVDNPSSSNKREITNFKWVVYYLQHVFRPTLLD